jgi:hypothetical protein
MKLIVNENQLEYLINESINPCPEGKKEDGLVTLNDIRKGKIIAKGYCNSNPESAIVKIQTMLQKKGLLDSSSHNGYYGDKTSEAIKTLLKPTYPNPNGDKIGPVTLEVLLSNKVKPGTSLNAYDLLPNKKKILVTTLLGEARGEGYEGMLAIANVLNNRTKNPEFIKHGGVVNQALVPYQFSMWNDYTVNKQPMSVIEKQCESRTSSELQNAIKIVNMLLTSNLSDNTGGATHYYKGDKNILPGAWLPVPDSLKWKHIKQIGKHSFGKFLKKNKK